MNPSSSPISWKYFNCLGGFMLTGAAFSVFFQKSPGGCGDYPQNFQVLYQGMGLGAGLGIVFLFFYTKIPNAFAVQSLLITVIRYYLASVILSYGFAKVFTSQFPHLMANMDARFIELSPMRVAWSFFGYSRGYQIFLGWGEVIPAALLLFRRTTLLGALIMFVVMLNVFLVNIFFDVCVKLNSGIYTVLAMYLLLQEFNRLWTFFIANKLTGPRPEIVLEWPTWLKISSHVLNFAALAYILWTAGQGAFGTYKYANTHVANTAVQGPWKTVILSQWKDNQWQSMERADSLFADRLFFDGFNGVIRSDFIRDRFRFSIDSTKRQLTVNFTNARNEWNMAPATWRYERVSNDSLNLWVRWKTDSLRLKCAIRKETLTRY
jgi:uncharacterized membrane protein YphA (DoxX/SURF4 family)